MDSQPNSGSYVARLQLIVSSYLDDGESLESAARRFADLLVEWNQALSKLPAPTQSFPAASVSTIYVNECLGDIRPDMSREDYVRMRELVTAAMVRMGGSVDGAV